MNTIVIAVMAIITLAGVVFVLSLGLTAAKDYVRNKNKEGM